MRKREFALSKPCMGGTSTLAKEGIHADCDPSVRCGQRIRLACRTGNLEPYECTGLVLFARGCYLWVRIWVKGLKAALNPAENQHFLGSLETKTPNLGN